MISVIIATYNRDNLIERAVESVLSQTFTDFELIIVDDCSTDNTSKIINKINDLRIKYIYLEENCGAGKARNIAVASAKGEFITFLDSDDFYYNNSVLKKIDTASKNNDVVAFGEYCIEENEYRKIEKALIDGAVYKYLMEHPLHYIGKPPYAIRKEKFITAGGFSENPRWGEAVRLWRRLFKNGANLNIVDDIGYVVSIHSGERVSKGGAVKSRKEGKQKVFDVFLSSFNDQSEYLNNNKVSKAIWLILLLKLSKGMRNINLFRNIIKQILSNGILNHFSGYYLLKMRKIKEG